MLVSREHTRKNDAGGRISVDRSTWAEVAQYASATFYHEPLNSTPQSITATECAAVALSVPRTQCKSSPFAFGPSICAFTSENKIMNVPQKFNTSTAAAEKMYTDLPQPPVFATAGEERLHRKQRLAASFRLFSKFGFDEGVVGHITARDPEFTDTFWVNPFGMHFSQIKASDLIRVGHDGKVVEGSRPVNAAAFAIHSRVHAARPDSVGAAHSHSTYGRAFVCAFYNDHGLYEDYGGVAVELDEGRQIADALGSYKAVILQNHGLLTVGQTVDEAAWWFITMDRSCQVQLLAEAAAARTNQSLKLISEASASQARQIVGTPFSGWFQFQSLYARILREQTDFLD
jgi:ribulose-5-phosphate 4-epimerase/fuculose-1-phosphate aldolase